MYNNLTRLFSPLFLGLAQFGLNIIVFFFLLFRSSTAVLDVLFLDVLVGRFLPGDCLHFSTFFLTFCLNKTTVSSLRLVSAPSTTLDPF